jgi:rsbT co-antagonist protein RsbR
MPQAVLPDFVLTSIIAQHQREIVDGYVAMQQKTRAAQLMSEAELRRQGSVILEHLQRGGSYDREDPSFAPLRQELADLSRTRALQGFSPAETATSVFLLKDALLPLVQQALADSPSQLAQHMLHINQLLDAFALFTFETYAQSREELIREQSRAILELSTPVVSVWEDILAIPLVGSVDTARTQQIMESLLTRITETGSSIVIMDITGVPVVDTAVAKHLLQTVAAARLLGAEVIIVGISARIAQTLVHLGIDLSSVITRTSLAKGLEYAFARTGQRVVRLAGPQALESGQAV